MKYVAIVLALVLCACTTTVPVKRKFPDAPEEFKVACPDLKQVPEDTTELSAVVAVVADNYALYKECQVKTDLWIEWYKQQREIFESVK